MASEIDYTLEFLLTFHGRVHYLEQGYWIKFEIERVKATKHRPYGVSYSFTLHGPHGKRLVGFDNAHGGPQARFSIQAPHAGERSLAPHRDRSGTTYAFIDADTLLRDFFREVRRVLAERGISEAVVRVEKEGK